jgi:site-specific DNA-cytosine methylase
VDDGFPDEMVQHPDGKRLVHRDIRKRWSRKNELKALGNAVVPQCAEVVGWVIRELMEGRP